MKKILFLIHTLGGGGAEKALVNLVNHLDREKYDITVETMFGDGIHADELKPDIHYISMKAPCPKGTSILLKVIPASFLYKHFIGKKNYDLLVAYMHGAPVKVIAGNPKVKKMVWLHNGNPATSTMFTSWPSEKAAIKAYDSCDAIVGVCQSVRDAFCAYTNITDKVRVVYNTLDIESIKEQAKETVPIDIDHQFVNLISVGRLGKEKGYSRLINVCSKLKNAGYKCRLYLVGGGSEEISLKTQIKQLSLEDEVFLLGYHDNPYAYIDKCDVFVCSSFTEGLSTATVEALILGKAIVSTEVSGAREILGDSEYGIIVENSEEGLETGIRSLLENKEDIKKYGSKAAEHTEFFSVGHTVKQAEEVIDSVLDKG